MSGVAEHRNGFQIDHGFIESTQLGVPVVSTTANTLGSLVEILSATNNVYDSDSFDFICYPQFATTDSHRVIMFDLVVESSGVQIPIVEGMFLQGTQVSSDEGSVYCYSFPVKIAAGQRILARQQCTHATDTAYCTLRRNIGGPRGFAGIVSYGFDRSDTSGILGPIATTNAWQTPVEIVSAVNNHYNLQGFIISRAKEVSSWTNGVLGCQIMVGAVGKEIPVSGVHYFLTPGGTEEVSEGASPFIPAQIPAGQRISFRVVANTTANDDADFEHIFHGVY